MGQQLAQMSTLASACASPLHSASYAMDKSINTRSYASVFVRICPYAEQRIGPRWPWSASVIGWNTSIGLLWAWKFNMFEFLRRRMQVYALGATSDRSINNCADSRMHTARMEYKPGLRKFIYLGMLVITYDISMMIRCGSSFKGKTQYWLTYNASI